MIAKGEEKETNKDIAVVLVVIVQRKKSSRIECKEKGIVERKKRVR